jgi:hypothetical protein
LGARNGIGHDPGGIIIGSSSHKAWTEKGKKAPDGSLGFLRGFIGFFHGRIDDCGRFSLSLEFLLRMGAKKAHQIENQQNHKNQSETATATNGSTVGITTTTEKKNK